MRVELLENFITKEEAEVLNLFTINGVINKTFSEGICSKHLNPPNTQMVTRFDTTIKFPLVAMDILERLKLLLKLENKDIHTLFSPSSIVVNCSFEPARVVKHIDSKQNGLSLLRCNVLSSAPEEGGLLHVDDVPIPQNELSVYFCLVTDHYHHVSAVKGKKPRILWQYGFNVDTDDWNSGKIKVR